MDQRRSHCPVSIVSIQTDQSRLIKIISKMTWFTSFNRINPNRSIPTWYSLKIVIRVNECFNRINPNRSIPTNPELTTEQMRAGGFNRINPNRSIPTHGWSDSMGKYSWVSIVSIQTDQSRPQPGNNSLIEFFMFQSYQSKQINPDSYPRGASRGAALRCRMAEPIFERLNWLKSIQHILYII